MKTWAWIIAIVNFKLEKTVIKAKEIKYKKKNIIFEVIIL